MKQLGLMTAGLAGASTLPARLLADSGPASGTDAGAPAGKLFRIPDVETHLIASRNVEQTYEVRVMQPLMRTGERTRFPVLYITDGNMSFEVAKGISHSLQGPGQVRRYILVGIGYPGRNPHAGDIFRGRDYTSKRRAEIPGRTVSSPIEGVAGIAAGKKRWQGADEFLAFVRDELSVLIDTKYPTVPGDRAYFGHSLGGGLGLHALFSQSDLFNRYVCSSPSISYDGDDYGIREAQDFIASGKRLDAKVYMSVGEEEELDPNPAISKPHFVSSVFRLASLLRGAQIPGLDLKVRSYDGETHASVWPIAFTHGVQFIFGPAERPPMA